MGKQCQRVGIVFHHLSMFCPWFGRVNRVKHRIHEGLGTWQDVKNIQDTL
jgi:hypothetical protein